MEMAVQSARKLGEIVKVLLEVMKQVIHHGCASLI